MKLSEIYYEKKRNDGNYESTTLGLRAVLSEEDDAQECLQKVKDIVAESLDMKILETSVKSPKSDKKVTKKVAKKTTKKVTKKKAPESEEKVEVTQEMVKARCIDLVKKITGTEARKWLKENYDVARTADLKPEQWEEVYNKVGEKLNESA